MPKIRKTPPPSLLPDREIEICGRFRLARQKYRFKQAEFADALDISLERLKSYEYCRAPISYGLGDSLCSTFDINQRWLAVGTEPFRVYLDPAPWMELFIPSALPFSRVYDRLLEEYLGKALMQSEGWFRMQLAGGKKELITAIAGKISTSIQERLDNSNEQNSRELIEGILDVIGETDPAFRSRLFALVNQFESSDEKLTDIRVEQDMVLQKLGLTFEEYRRLNQRSNKSQRTEFKSEYSEEGIVAALTEGAARRISLAVDENQPSPQNDMQLKERIKSARKSLNLSQQKAAKEWGISVGTLRDWEQGRKAPRGLYSEKIEGILASVEASS